MFVVRTPTVRVSGKEFTYDQISRALDACYVLIEAYAKVMPENGGKGRAVDVDDVNAAWQLALEAMPQHYKDEAARSAKSFNTPMVEHKKPEDTEGGSAD